jgi:hypothetical protein
MDFSGTIEDESQPLFEVGGSLCPLAVFPEHLGMRTDGAQSSSQIVAGPR